MRVIEITKPDSQKLSAYAFIPESGCRYILIICHGFRGTKENGGRIFNFADRLMQLGMGVLAFDFSGCGNSDGEFSKITLSRQARDLRHVIDYVYQAYNLPIILLGRSFGGSTILAGGATDKRVAGYIFWATPVKLRETFARIFGKDYEQLKTGRTITVKDESGIFELKTDIARDFDMHDMDKYLAALGEKPVLVVHGLADEVVDPSNAVYIYQRAKNTRLELVEGADHRFLNKISEREDLTISWLKENFLTI